jgi:hypothetical protein
MFNSNDEFALKVKSKFAQWFTFFDVKLKDFLLMILKKLFPPLDPDKRQSFYRFFSEEYAAQNNDKFISADNIEILLNCIFFFIEKQEKKLKHSRVTLDQFISYAEEQGENIISAEEVKRYFKEIQSNTFLPHHLDIKIGIEGKYKADKNFNFVKNSKNFGWRATPGDIFFWERTKMYKLELKGMKIRRKEVCIDENDSKLLWFNEGKNKSHSVRLKDIIDVEMGITDTFLRYMKEEMFQELIQDDVLWLSVKTMKRSYDFYGNSAKEVQIWYDRLSIEAKSNKEEWIDKFSDEKYEPSLLEIEYDKVKEIVWETKIIPNFNKYFDCCSDKPIPINYKPLKIKYEIPKYQKSSSNPPVTKSKSLSLPLTSLILCGLPCQIRPLLYPILIPNHQSLSPAYTISLLQQ